MNSNRHHLLEGRSCSQNLDINNEDAATTALEAPTSAALASASAYGWDNRTGGSDGRSYACGVTNLVIAHGLEDLLLDALLTCLVKIREISCPKILPLGVLLEALLTIGLHAINILLCIIAHAWIVLVGANNNVLAIAKFCPRVWPAAAVTRREEALTPAPSGSSSSRPVGGVATTLGVAFHCHLGLTGIGACNGTGRATSTRGGHVEGLREPYSFTRNPSDHEEVILSLLGGLEHLLQHPPLVSGIQGLNHAMLGEITAKSGEETRVKAILKMSTHADGIIPLA